MKKQFILVLLGIFLAAGLNAQKVKTPEKDTGNAYRATDRLRNAGPKNKNKTDSAKKIKNAATPPRSKKQDNR